MIRSYKGKSPRIAASAFISEFAYVIGDVEIGENSNVWPGAVIRGDCGSVKIGRNTSLEDNCVVHTGADLVIGDNVIVGHGAVVHCSSIGNNVLIGNNATVLNEVEVGNCCIVGAGSLVTEGTMIPDGSVAVGMPARVRGKTSQQQLDWIQDGTRIYTRLAQEYRQQGL